MDTRASQGGVELVEIKQQLLDLGAPENLVKDWTKVMEYLSKSSDKIKLRSYLESLRDKLVEAPAEVKESYNNLVLHFDFDFSQINKRIREYFKRLPETPQDFVTAISSLAQGNGIRLEDWVNFHNQFKSYKGIRNFLSKLDDSSIISDDGKDQRFSEWLKREDVDHVITSIDDLKDKGKYVYSWIIFDRKNTRIIYTTEKNPSKYDSYAHMRWIYIPEKFSDRDIKNLSWKFLKYPKSENITEVKEFKEFLDEAKKKYPKLEIEEIH